MQIVNMPVEDLREYENNPRINDDAVEPVARSIEVFGFKNPIIIDSKNVIIAGHTRLKAAKFLGMDEVPCIVADDLTEEQANAFRLADNKVAELAKWDLSALDMELVAIDFDMEEFGFCEIEEIELPHEEEDEYKEYEDESGSLKETFEVIVTCEDEIDLQETYDKLVKEGYKCRVLTL